PHYAVIEPLRMWTPEDENVTIRIGNEYEGAPIGCFRLSVTTSEFPEVMPENIAKILHADAASRTEEDERILRRYYLSHPVEMRRANQQTVKLMAEKVAIENKI